jgi:peptidoglycan hydrolase-like protein with peptidoglycan-binding domain
MDWRAVAAAVLLVAPSLTVGGSAFTSIHPEEAYPDPSPDAQTAPYSGLISKVQERLRELGFDAGPVNGDFGSKTQAALAQFQLSANLNASGQLDDATLEELGVKRDDNAGAGASGER